MEKQKRNTQSTPPTSNRRHRKHPVALDTSFDRVYNADQTLDLHQTVAVNLRDKQDKPE